ncbi:yojK [Symbiodinium sp. CCMP2456]|nr:yojK [Symbiodinium sp. CCMP2456]
MPTQSSKSFAFIFPLAAGHINPSLAIARSLVQQGHDVHYLCREQMREAIEDTGAVFHSDIDTQPELYAGRDPSMWGALGSLQEEYGMKGESLSQARLKLRELAVELMLPGTLRWLEKIKAQAVLCDPLINLEAPLAARVAGIPCVALLTVAGPGGQEIAWGGVLKALGTTAEKVLQERRQFQGLQDCIERLKKTYGLHLAVEDGVKPLGVFRSCLMSTLTLVTTSEFLADPMSPEVSNAYTAHDFVYLGPMLDKPGAKRAGGHKLDAAVHSGGDNDATALNLARDARAKGRQVVLVSLGTIITGDHTDYGWGARFIVDGQQVGISGRELCQAAWQAAFDVFGQWDPSSTQSPLILAALGPQADALEGLEVPPNAFCSPALPQVDLLRLGVDIFLTHGGQNSFTEALSMGVPLVVCPGFADQPVNAAKAESLQIGLKVDRPMRPLEHAEADKAAYRKTTADALTKVAQDPSFKERAMDCARALNACGGVSLATRILLEATSNSKLPLHLKQAGA